MLSLSLWGKELLLLLFPILGMEPSPNARLLDTMPPSCTLSPRELLFWCLEVSWWKTLQECEPFNPEIHVSLVCMVSDPVFSLPSAGNSHTLVLTSTTLVSVVMPPITSQSSSPEHPCHLGSHTWLWHYIAWNQCHSLTLSSNFKFLLKWVQWFQKKEQEKKKKMKIFLVCEV